MSTFADHALAYYLNLAEPENLPPGVSVLNPYRRPEVREVVTQFFRKFYDDTAPRVFVLGINPGRYGAGVTGVSFTTPQALTAHCGIPNALPPTPELSSKFIYKVVEAFGGPTAFYGKFFLSSLYPLALIREGKNYNYYDDRATTAALWPIITETVRQQLQFGAHRRVAVCLGRKNETYLRRLNEEQGFFDNMLTLDHPRYILQYRAREADAFAERYIRTLGECIG
jgi:hypothetical protein